MNCICIHVYADWKQYSDWEGVTTNVQEIVDLEVSFNFPRILGCKTSPPPKKRGSLEPIDSKRIDETNLLSR